MKRKLVIFSLILGLVALPLAAACAAPAPAPTPAAKTTLVIATGPTVWGSYAETVGWADIVTKNSNVRLNIEATGGATAMQEAVAIHRMDLTQAMTYSDIAMAYLGESRFAGLPWTPSKNLRLVISGLSVKTACFMTSPKTGLNTIADLKGKTLPTLAESSLAPMMKPLLEAYGVDPENDVKWVAIPTSTPAKEQLILGRVDATFDQVNAEQLSFQEDVGQIVWLPVPPEKLAQARAAHPVEFRGSFPFVLTPGYIPGLKVPGPIQMIGAAATVAAHASVLDDPIYTIVMTLVKNADKVQALGGAMVVFSLEQVLPPVDAVGEVPYHPGAIKAFKELGIWTDKHEARQKELLSKLGQ